MDCFWVYANPARGRVLIHRAACPACEGNKPYVLERSAQPGYSWTGAGDYQEASEVAAAVLAGRPGIHVVDCVICEPAEPRWADRRQRA
jgi:hypothetical protein